MSHYDVCLAGRSVKLMYSLACKTWVQETKKLSVQRGEDMKGETKATEWFFMQEAQKFSVL